MWEITVPSSEQLTACRFVRMHNPIVPSGLRHNSMPTSGMRARGRLLVRNMSQTYQQNAKPQLLLCLEHISTLPWSNVCGLRSLMQ